MTLPRRLLLLVAAALMVAVMLVATAGPALAFNTGEQKGPGATGPPLSSGGQNTVAFHCLSPDITGTPGAIVFNQNHVKDNCH